MAKTTKSAEAMFAECAAACEWVEVVLKDGRTFQGNAIRNPMRQTGTIVNAVSETRHDFSLDDIQSVRRVADPRQITLN